MSLPPKPDADEAEIWLRHPVTKWLIAMMNRIPPISHYRDASDLLSLGEARGHDETMRMFNNLLADLRARPTK